MDIWALGIYASLFLSLYFEVFLFISFFERRPYKKTLLKPHRYPTVSMLVPCFNEERTLAQTVDSLLALDYPQEKLEVVIVDDGSTDRTRAIGEELARKNPRITFIHKENGGKYTALNLGIERSTAELVGCLDADSFVAPDALIEVVKSLEADPAIMAVTPAMKVYRPRTILEAMQAVEYTFGIFYKKMFDNLAALNVLPGPFSIYRRDVFKKIGLFRHAHNTEDMEIAFRMHANGLKIVNAHTAFVYTTVPKTVRGLIKQRTRWSQGFLQNSRDYKYMYFNPRYGNFGMLVLPLGLSAFVGGIYTAGYTLYRSASFAWMRVSDLWATGIPPHLPVAANFTWYYINTSMMVFLIVAVFCMTIASIALGHRIAQTELRARSFVYYFALFGFIAPVWLARAAVGAMLSRDASWR
ncbi:MAG: glycosyltransferase family 2 protein [Patescibacteria group bacterium]|nr:glycosyltransferase family 2 protein [Patescibacteria group bacterium]